MKWRKLFQYFKYLFQTLTRDFASWGRYCSFCSLVPSFSNNVFTNVFWTSQKTLTEGSTRASSSIITIIDMKFASVPPYLSGISTLINLNKTKNIHTEVPYKELCEASDVFAWYFRLIFSRDILSLTIILIPNIAIGTEQLFFQKHVHKGSYIERLHSKRTGRLFCHVNLFMFMKQIRRLFWKIILT